MDEASLQDTIAREPGNAEALMHLGLSRLRTGRHADAQQLFARMRRAAPANPAAHNGLGIALAALGRLQEAIASFDRGLALDPHDAAIWANRGLALCDLPDWDEALENFARALAFRPEFPAADTNAGVALHRLGRLDEAIARFDRVLAADPNDPWARFNRSLSLLAQGDHARGWEEYEWRWRSALAHVNTDFPTPRWLGQFPIEGKTILVHAEQGMGDTLQFCRYVPLLADRARVVLVVPEPLRRLMESLRPGIEVLAPGTQPPPHDAWVPMMSLPLACRTMPRTVPYLHPPQTGVWRDRVGRLPGRKIGLVWSGAPRPEDVKSALIDRRRSMRLDCLAPLAAVPGISWVSLQKGPAAEQAKTPPAGMHLHDWTAELNDFADTAALIETLDLVISVDTSAAHLAGALGKPVWILNRFDQCWRWLHGRTDSPWYPAARLFRQDTPGDWSAVLRDVTGALRKI